MSGCVYVSGIMMSNWLFNQSILVSSKPRTAQSTVKPKNNQLSHKVTAIELALDLLCALSTGN